jgi:hypothetical protein
MKNMWEVKWWRVALALIIIFAALFAVDFIGEQWADWQEVHDFCRDNPNLATLPIPLPDQGVAKLDGARLEMGGLAFSASSKEILRRRDFSHISFVNFNDGLAISTPDWSSGLDLEKFIQANTRSKKEADETRRLLGSRVLNCCYGLLASELAITPSGLKWWNTWRTRRIAFTRLTTKSIDIGKANAIYEINAGEMRGFQMGNPAVAPYEVVLDLFDQGDRRHEIRINDARADRPFISQSEINAIVASMKPIKKN